MPVRQQREGRAEAGCKLPPCPSSSQDHPFHHTIALSPGSAETAGDVPLAAALGLLSQCLKENNPPSPPDSQHHKQTSHLQNDPGRQGRQKAAFSWELKWPEREKSRFLASLLRPRCPTLLLSTCSSPFYEQRGQPPTARVRWGSGRFRALGLLFLKRPGRVPEVS